MWVRLRLERKSWMLTHYVPHSKVNVYWSERLLQQDWVWHAKQCLPVKRTAEAKQTPTSHGPTDHQDGTKVLTSAFSLAEIWPISLSSPVVAIEAHPSPKKSWTCTDQIWWFTNFLKFLRSIFSDTECARVSNKGKAAPCFFRKNNGVLVAFQQGSLLVIGPCVT